MIYCVWYPSGGFGHFINAILTLHGDNFIRPIKTLEFSKNGSSHNLDLVVPKYLHECWPGGIEFRNDRNYCVLIDNGINNESDKFKSTFPNAIVIKICYSKFTWPVVACTMIEKAMGSSIKEQLPTDVWETNEPWTQREKYFLFLRDHPLRHCWNETKENCLDVGEIYEDYEEFFNMLNSIVKTEPFDKLWLKWREANARYIDPAKTAMKVLSCVITKQSDDLTYITDIWSQAVIYYYIWLKYNVEVPHNAYADWFTNTKEIVTMLRDNGVEV